MLTNDNTVNSMESRYLAQRGLAGETVQGLNDALRVVLDSMEPKLYESDGSGLTEEEKSVLEAGGARLEAEDGDDPFAAATVSYAALVHTSKSTKETADTLGITPGRIRQMVADRSLYSFVIDNRRYLPLFQFNGNQLVGNITKVNQALPVRMHPVAVLNWYELANRDLVVNEEENLTLSPLDWLKGGYPIEDVLVAASYL